jgi:hypothetical protein
MAKLSKILCILSVFVSTPAAALVDNPFAKAVDINVGGDVIWQVNSTLARKTTKSADGTYYHLSFTGTELRLRVGESAEDSDAFARKFDQFAVEDVSIDGQRLPLFQWCLQNQEGHDRFLQQGMSVKQSLCDNQGASGLFIMHLNQATLAALTAGKKLSFTLKPYRTSISINYALGDFAAMVAKLVRAKQPSAATAAPATSPTVQVKQICQLAAPPDLPTLAALDYICDDATARAAAANTMSEQVNTERAHLKQLEAEKERKRQADLIAKKKAEEEAKQLEAQKLREQEAIAASQMKQQEINSEITTKMLGVCGKMWAKGEHRCYCEKYIDQAPEAIKASSTCSGG